MNRPGALVAVLLLLVWNPAELAASAEDADDVVLIVQRDNRAVEMFFGMPARTAVRRFGLDPALLQQADGRVEFAAFRQGTWDIGDALLEMTDVRIGDAPAKFESTSLMVHLNAQRLPFDTPLDALTAISVCGVEPPEVPPALDDLYLYAGFVTYSADPAGPLRIVLPPGGRGAVKLKVRQFRDGALLAVREVTAEPGKPFVVGGVVPLLRRPVILVLVVCLFGLALLVLIVRRRLGY